MPGPNSYPKELKAKALEMHFVQGIGHFKIASELKLPTGLIGNWLSTERSLRRKASDLVSSEVKAAELENVSESNSLKVVTGVESRDSSAQTEELERRRAMRLLSRAMKSRTPKPKHQIEAAKAILAKAPKPVRVDNPDAWKSQYAGMKDSELGERLVTCAATLMGIEALYVVVERLRKEGQLDVVSTPVSVQPEV